MKHKHNQIFFAVFTLLLSVQMIQAQVPIINSFSPSSGPVGTTVTLIGENFSPIAASNIVWFGAVAAPVTSAQSTQLVVDVPTYASQAPIRVTVNGLLCVAPAPFIVTYSGSAFSSSSLTPAITLPSGIVPTWIENTDFDGDGKPDLVVANYTDNTISVYRNISTNGTLTVGSFAARVTFSVGVNPRRVAVGDIDGDGKPDVVASHAGGTSVSVFRNVSTPGTFTTNSFTPRVEIPTPNASHHLMLADMNGDGKLDLVVANFGASSVSIFRNVANLGSITTNSFAARVDFGTVSGPHGLAIGDLDGDGKPDIAVSSASISGMSILRNTTTPGSATITLAGKVDFATPARPYGGLAIGDIDSDGKPDIAVSVFDADTISVFKNISSAGSFTSNSLNAGFSLAVGGTPIGILIVDIDGDGKSDLCSTTGSSANKVAVFRNVSTNGSLVAGSFGPRIDFAAASNPHSLIVGDLDGDGRPDVVAVANFADVLSLYRNINSPLPIITTQPQSRTVAPGTNVTFSVVATGAQPLTYQWLFNGTNIGSATTSSLTLSNVQPANSGNYSVFITNSAGSVTSSIATLAVVIPPAITVQPQSQNVQLGSNATFSVTATGSSLAYRWRFNGSTISNATSSSYSIANAQSTNIGGYSVVITNAIGSVTSVVANLTINASPIITLQPQNQTVGAGSNVTFTVGAGGGDPALPVVPSGTLKLWLKADAGVTVNGQKVTQWSDQSANTNHARQLDTNLQPSLVAGAIPVSGKPAIRFDGIQSPTTGDFLQATGNVNLAGNYTSFLVYNKANRVVAEEAPVVVGIPNINNAIRSYYVRSFGVNNEMAFSGWGNDVGTGFSIPTNTVRIWTDRLNGSQLGFFDTDGTSSFTITQGIGGLSTPGAGYYIGGLGGFTRNFQGDIAEVIFYQGALSDSDRISVQNYLKQKYYQTSTPGGGTLTYQWKFAGNNIIGAIDSSLTLTNVQSQNAGTYSVVVSNNFGETLSSNAVLTVVVPPSITVQPQNQSALAGSNVNFSVTASGTSPLHYQWSFNGIGIPGATSSAYSINNAQPTNAGNYSVVVTNAAGSAQSDSASLQILTPPSIVLQPQSQSVIAGTNVTFSVTAEAFLPTAPSGNLRLWLKADQGVIAANGRVIEWRDQSANGNHAFQSNTNKQPLFVGSAVPISNKPTVRFDGIQDVNTGDWMRGTNSVGIPTGYTSFLVYSRGDRTISEQALVGIGIPAQQGALRSYFVRNSGEMAFSGWNEDFGSGFIIPANNYRIWTDRLNDAKSLLEFFDVTETNTTSFSNNTGGLATPGAGYYLGGLDAYTRNFKGDISELIIYQGALTDPDRIAVQNYLKAKYYSALGGNALSYQWLFNGADIVGATNSSLTLSNVQPANVGNYSVVITNLAGSTTSSNATLTVNVSPSITTQPQTQSINAGSTATFTVGASGTAPLSYQWQKNLANLPGATDSSFVLNSVQPSDAGNYRVIVSSPYGTATSSNAVLTVKVSTVRVISTNTVSASNFVLPIEFAALGNENALGFSLSFDPNIFTFTGANLGGGLSGVTLISNTNQLANGKLGLAVALSANQTFAAGTQQLVQVSFKIAPVTNAVGTSVNFSDQPTVRQVSGVSANVLWSSFIGGIVSIAAVDFEGDVSPRPTGNRALTITDWVQVGRFAAGLDTVANAEEFQRADCAPRNNLGNGSISITDWVQAGRYGTGVDPLTPVGGPAAKSSGKQSSPTAAGDANRIVNLEGTTQEGQTNVVFVRLIAQGDENAMGFSLAFDPAILTFIEATNGGNAAGALLNVNSNDLSSGSVGVALALATGDKFAPGTQEVIKLTFVAAPTATGSTTLTFTDIPVLREVSDVTANALPASFSNGSLVLTLPGPLLTISRSANGVVLSWPATATNFVLEGSSALGTNWTSVTTDLTTNAQSVSATLPVGEQQQFFRLKK